MAASENYEPACKRLAEINALEQESKERLKRAEEKRNKSWKLWSFFGGSRRKAAV
jgi:hypothetical protein